MGSSGTSPGSVTAEPDSSTSNPQSLHREVHARRSEYLRCHRVRIKVGTWNVAACPGTDKDLARWFVDGEGLDPALGPSKPFDTAAEGRRGTGEESSGDEAIPVAGNKIGLYVLGLQEVSVLTAPGQYMSWFSADHTTTAKWKAALEAALPDGYQFVASQQLAGMLLLAYASPEVAPTISNVSSTYVPAGALNYLGNKGGVCTRIVLGEATQLVFVNSHLASGVDDYYVERRIGQAQAVMTHASFDPIVISGVAEDEKTRIGDEDFAFWFGDLNFRLDRLPGDDIRRLLTLHTRGEYDLSKRHLRREDSLDGEPIVVHRLSDSSDDVSDRSPPEPQAQDPGKAADAQGADDDSLNLPDPDEFPENPNEDPASLQATLDSLLPHDQLRRLIKERKLFHDGWREGPICFLPTYKYDVGTVALFDSSEKRRPPSWCDRILFRTRRDFEEYERRVREDEERRKKDEEMKARGIGDSDDEDVLFSYDPEVDGEEQPKSALEYDEYDDADDGGGAQASDEAGPGRIHLELYTSHQRITSSDHKPVSAIFTLEYDAAVPELKAKVHAEVARLLDRAENEGRPVVTVVLDHHDRRASAQSGSESSPHVDFGDVRFLKQYTASLTLANTGGVPATLSFVENKAAEDPEGDESKQAQWLMTSFVHSDAADGTEPVDLGKEVTLEPGETMNAVLDVQVDDVGHARMLSEGQATLEDVLVLRVADGRDHFIPVRASWAPTCIGRSVEELIRVPDGGIRAFFHSLLEKQGEIGSIPHDLPTHRPAPRELFQLIEAMETLTQRALADAQMLEGCTIPTDYGWPFDESTCRSTDVDTRTAHITSILDALDRDEPLQSAFAPETSAVERLEAVAQTLLVFLRGLADGIVPTPLWNRIDQAAASIPSLANPAGSGISPLDDAALDNDRTTVLDILQSAPNHNICFVFLTTTLARAVAELAPLSRAELDLLKNDSPASTSPPPANSPVAAVSVRGIGGVLGGVGRKSLSLVRRGTNSAVAEALAALEKRRARERTVAEVFAGVVCRGLAEGMGVKERRAGEARRRAVMELFLRRRE